jgi:hypothetical protein
MKKLMVCALFFAALSLPVFAQGFYLDVGLGIGKGWTKLNGNDFVTTVKDAGGSVTEVAVDVGFKAGYGPFGSVPLYVVGELAAMGHRIDDGSNYMLFNSALIGPGVIFYPIQLVQLGFSLGYSLTANETDIPWVGRMYDSKSGFAWNISAAIDLGKRNHGCLIGLMFFSAHNTLEVTNAKQKSSMVGIFVKYTYRKKAPSLF